MGKLRENVFNNKTLKDNRVSFGCVNFLVNSYDKMRSLVKGLKTKVYILPEEKGNSLHLENQKDGSYKFFQTKYRYESQEPKTKKIKKIVSKPVIIKDSIPVDSLRSDSTKIVLNVSNDTVKKENLSEVKISIPDIFE